MAENKQLVKAVNSLKDFFKQANMS